MEEGYQSVWFLGQGLPSLGLGCTRLSLSGGLGAVACWRSVDTILSEECKQIHNIPITAPGLDETREDNCWMRGVWGNTGTWLRLGSQRGEQWGNEWENWWLGQSLCCLWIFLKLFWKSCPTDLIEGRNLTWKNSRHGRKNWNELQITGSCPLAWKIVLFLLPYNIVWPPSQWPVCIVRSEAAIYHFVCVSFHFNIKLKLCDA